MELCFRKERVGGELVEILRVKSNSETDFTGTTRVETVNSIMVVTDVFDVIKKTNHAEDPEGNTYDWYYVENHYQTQERFTPEKQEDMDSQITKQRGDIDYIAMMADIELETEVE